MFLNLFSERFCFYVRTSVRNGLQFKLTYFKRILIMFHKYTKTLLLSLGLMVFPGAQADHLIQAIHAGEIEPLILLLQVGTDINQLGGSRTDRGSTKMYFARGSALHFAAHRDRQDMVRLLVKHGANVDVRDENDFTPLHKAAWEGSLDMVKLLLESGADIQAGNRFNHTPLSLALDNNRPEVAEYLRTRLQ